MKIEKNPFTLISNLEEAPVVFDMVPEKSLLPKGKKAVAIQTCGSEKRHVTVVLTVVVGVFGLPPMIIFRGKTNQTIKDTIAPSGTSWMNPSLLFIWCQQI